MKEFYSLDFDMKNMDTYMHSVGNFAGIITEHVMSAQMQPTANMDWINIRSMQVTYFMVFACHRLIKVEGKTALRFIDDDPLVTDSGPLGMYSTRSILWRYLKGCIYQIFLQYATVIFLVYVTKVAGPIPDSSIAIVYIMICYTGMFLYSFRTFNIRTNIFLMMMLVFFGLADVSGIAILWYLFEVVVIMYSCNPVFGFAMKISDLTSSAPVSDKGI